MVRFNGFSFVAQFWIVQLFRIIWLCLVFGQMWVFSNLSVCFFFRRKQKGETNLLKELMVTQEFRTLRKARTKKFRIHKVVPAELNQFKYRTVQKRMPFSEAEQEVLA